MKLAAQIVLLAAALGGILLILFGPMWALPSGGPVTRTVKAVHPSPSGGHVATLVEVSGGGAAGYVYQAVLLRSGQEPEDQLIVERLYGSRLQWLDDHQLRVDFRAGKPGRTNVDGVTVSYHEDRR